MTRRGISRPALLAVTLLGFLASFVIGFVYDFYQLRGSYLLRRALRWAEATRSKPDVGPFHLEEQPGRWVRAKQGPRSAELTADQREAIADLQTIGYLEGYEPATGSIGVTVHVPGLTSPGLNLYSSGHGPIAVLTDMEGNVLHRWQHPSPFPSAQDRRNPLTEFWRRVYLYENGDLLAIYDGIGLIKLDKDSNLLWAAPCGAHHDLEVDEDGFIYVLTREAKMLARIDESDPILEGFISVLDSQGNVVREVSLLEAFERSSYSSLLSNMPESGDLMHTNTIELLDGTHVGRSPIFKKGNALISVLELDLIAIIDLDEEKVVWALTGQWRKQHQPTMLEDGSLLLLDNIGHHGMSKVVEIDPFTQEILWAYEGNEANGFSTETCGSNQRLPNGNTLITESDSGRAFEVTRDKRIVWEFRNPARAGENDEFVATLFEVIRLRPDFPTGWAHSVPVSDGER